MQAALVRGEGTLGKGGAFYCTTGKHTGRSPKDKFVVRTPEVEETRSGGKTTPDGAARRLTACTPTCWRT